nr:hemolysin family protein [Ardenticatena sp.]
MNILIILSILSILILINALYVAGEFSFVSARHSRLAQMAEEGNRLAASLHRFLDDRRNLDNVVAACQLGITVSSLVLGYYGQAQLSPIVANLLLEIGIESEAAALSVSATTVLIGLTIAQVIFGELVPKNIAVQYPERLALTTYVPLQWSLRLFRPLIIIFNGSGNLLLHLLGQEPVSESASHLHSPDELLMLVEESSEGGVLDKIERHLLLNTLRLRELNARQVMIPRTRIVADPASLTVEQLFERLAASPYSRMPLYEGTIDNIVGLVHLKTLFCLKRERPHARGTDIMQPVLMVPESMDVEKLFLRLQSRNESVAIVLDEYGGTAGMVTLEDILEEIFGEIQDEFDTEISPVFVDKEQKRLCVRGDVLISDLNEWLDLYLDNDEVDTIAGYVLLQLGRLPEEGESIPLGEKQARIEKMEGHTVLQLSIPLNDEELKKIEDVIP